MFRSARPGPILLRWRAIGPRRLRILFAATVAAFIVSLIAPAAFAQQRSPSRQRVLVEDIRFTGVKSLSTRALKAALATKESSWLPWGRKAYFSRADFEADLKRIHAFYADHGYPLAKVATYDIRVNEEKDKVWITFHVEEGPPVRLASVSLFGFEVLSAEGLELLKSQIPVKVGDVRTQDGLVSSRGIAENALKEQAYPYARVQVLEGPGPEPMTVTLTLAAEPGIPAKFGPLTITGNTSVGDDVVRRQLAFGPGDPFKLSRVLESQRRLYNLELFQYVNFDVPDLETQPAEVPITATITEGKHRRLQVGVGYGSEERARISGNWRHVNFFGGARTAGAEAKWSSLDRGVRLNFREPYFFSPSYKLDLQVQQWFADEPAFDLLTRGGRASISRELVRHDAYGRPRSSTRASLSFIDEFEDYTVSEEALADPTFRDDLIALGLNPDTGRGHGTVVALAFDITHETAGTLLDARRGYVASLHLEKAASVLNGDFDYFEVTFEGRHYWTLGSWGVLANKVRFGSLDGPTAEVPPDADLDVVATNVPFFKRYFLGGATSLRGWSRYQVSPLNDSGFTTGGLSFLELISEVRFPIRGNLSGVLFAEAGNVWPDSWGQDLKDLRYDAGAGVRYNTPIGPVRFDFGYQINPIDGLLIDGEEQKRQWRVHFSIGQAF
jgi:outer membrane protein assembly complex protein YaeT